MRRVRYLVLLALLVPVLSTGAEAQEGGPFTNGAAGIGDPYFPMDGNGGYDVTHYGLELAYDPATDVLSGVATIDAVAKQDLARFNLDFDGLAIDELTLDGLDAPFSRSAGELRVTSPGITQGTPFVLEVTYHGVPQAGGGFRATNDGTLVVGQPHVASTWFPANDHPQDRAPFDIAMTVPDGLEAVSNGALVSHDSSGGETRWVWQAGDPMATYLATVDIGEFDLEELHADAGRPGGVDIVNAVDVDLATPVVPHSGTQFAISQVGEQTYKRLRRSIAVPAGGATMSFWINRDTETRWDHVMVEAHTNGQNDWTTLPDENGHTRTGTGNSCPFWLGLHPFLRHYQTPQGGGCRGVGTTGEWHARSGRSTGWEQWEVDLGDFAGSTVVVSISYVSDDIIQGPGVFVDDIVVSTGQGSTSFEVDGDVRDGWQVPGPPPGSIANVNNWRFGDVDDAPPTRGEVIDSVLGRQPEILDFLAANFGDYPFPDSGAIIDDFPIGFALENQTRPVYSPDFFGEVDSGESVVVHELAHQWFGDLISVRRWQHIWLNEGFATYAEWLWEQHEGGRTPQQQFNAIYNGIPGNDPFWDLRIGDPGAPFLFEFPVYLRGAMTLQALRGVVGSADFFQILQDWAAQGPPRLGTTVAFINLAEQVSGRQLDTLFHRWLFTLSKPPRPQSSAESSSAAPTPFVPDRLWRR